MDSTDKIVLNETYRNCSKAVDAIQNVLGKIGDEDLTVDLNRQAGTYRRFMNQIEKRMRQNGERPQEENVVEKTRIWAGIQLNTLLNTSTEHIANMMIQDNKRGIVEMMRVLHENDAAHDFCCEIANELMDFEEKNIKQLKYYL